MSERRVVVTGIGAISPLGNDLDATWKSLKEGRSGITRIEQCDASEFPCHIAGEVRDFDPKPFYTNPKDARRSDRYTQFALPAARMAMDDSGMDPESVDKTRIGVMVGSGIGGLHTLVEQHTVYTDKGAPRVSPFVIPMMIANIATGMISMEYGFGGPNMAIVTACATANNSVGEAWRIIKFGDAEAILAGGAEASIRDMGLAGFSNMRALSCRNDEPERASRPFDVDRDGFVMGEGAGVVMLEELEHARKRGARIYAELAGYGVSADAHHLSAPSPDGTGPARAMQMAMKHARVNPDVDRVIWAKVSFNCAMNSLCALLGTTPGPVLDSVELRDLAIATAMESCDVAAAIGIEADRDGLLETLELVQREHRHHKPSMLVDFLAGRRTEIESLNGAVAALGGVHGVPTPRIQTLLALVRAHESQYGRT